MSHARAASRGLLAALALACAALSAGCDFQLQFPVPKDAVPYEEDCGLFGIARLESVDNQLELGLIIKNSASGYRYLYGLDAAIVDLRGGSHTMGRYKAYYDRAVWGFGPGVTGKRAFPIDPAVIPEGSASLALWIGISDSSGMPPVRPTCRLVLPLN